MKPEKTFIDMIRKHIETEKKMARGCAKLEKMVHNTAAKLLLSEIELDTKKHASILKEILNVIEKAPPKRLWDHRIDSYVDSLVVRKELERHMEIEKNVLQQVNEEINRTGDEALKLLLQHIAEDEKKHHKSIETVVQHSYKLTK